MWTVFNFINVLRMQDDQRRRSVHNLESARALQVIISVQICRPQLMLFVHA